MAQPNMTFSPQMLQQFNQFKSAFTGGPEQAKQQVMQMLNSGKINNAQLQNAINVAKQFQSFIR
jgi:hypothetical protein